MDSQQHLPSIARPLRDNRPHLFEIVSQIKESISKKRYNHACEMAVKHYEQNKSILSNEEIYQLSWLCCIAIERKVTHRLTVRKKKYVPVVTEAHIKHLFAMEGAVHAIALPEIVRSDPKYFNLLENMYETMRGGLGVQGSLFERRGQEEFMGREGVRREVKKLVKNHLKICNAVLMYKINNRKSVEELRESVKVVQGIYDQFREDDFPSQHMDFELIKLSVMEVEGSRGEEWACEYRLPIGFLGKIYRNIKNEKEMVLDHYLSKLTSYIVLSFRNCKVGIEDMFILCKQVQYICKLLAEKYASLTTHIKENIFQTPMLGLKRQITIDREGLEEQLSRASKKGSSCFNTFSKISEKRVESKNKIQRPESVLKNKAQMALDIINYHLKGRKEIKVILERYFDASCLERIRRNDIENLLQSALPQRIRMKRMECDQLSEGEGIQGRSEKIRTLTKMLQDFSQERPYLAVEQEYERQRLKVDIPMRPQGKFVVKNIRQVNGQGAMKGSYLTMVENLIEKKREFEENMESQFEECWEADEPTLEDFQIQRINRIKSFKEKLQSIDRRKMAAERIQRIENESAFSKPGESATVQLLDQVIANNINCMLGLSKKQTKIKAKFQSQVVVRNKLSELKNQIMNLQTDRQTMVEKLVLRKKQNEQLQEKGINRQEELTVATVEGLLKENQDQVREQIEIFKKRTQTHISESKKLMKLDYNKKYSLISQGYKQPSIKLKLDGKNNKKSPELTFQQLQEEHQKLCGGVGQQSREWDLALSTQFDKLRRDVAKNQFLNQNEKKRYSGGKQKNHTIMEMTLEDQPQLTKF